MTITVRPIFYDLEFNGKNFQDEDACVTELAAYDPTRPEGSNRFYVLLEPEKGLSAKVPSVNFTDPTANLKKFKFREVWPKFQEWVMEGAKPGTVPVLIAHNNYECDRFMLSKEAKRIDSEIPRSWKAFDTLWLAGMICQKKSKSLQSLRVYYQVPQNDAHRAQNDVDTLYKVFLKMVGRAPVDEIYAAMASDHPIKNVATIIKTHKAVIPIFFDLETTGLLKKNKEDPGDNPHIVELSAYTPTRTGEFAKFSKLLNPGIPIPAEASNVHGIKDVDVADKQSFLQVWKEFKRWCNANQDPDSTVELIAHNCYFFDREVLELECKAVGKKFPSNWKFFDTLFLSRSLHAGNPDFRSPEKGVPAKFSHKLQSLRVYYDVPENHAHRAFGDVEVMYQVWERMLGNAPRKEVLKAMLDPHPIKAVVEIIRKSKGLPAPASSAPIGQVKRVKEEDQDKDPQAKRRTVKHEPAADEVMPLSTTDAIVVDRDDVMVDSSSVQRTALKRLRRVIRDEEEDDTLPVGKIEKQTDKSTPADKR